MARITVEDCLQQVNNRFELIAMATERARALKDGVTPIVSWDNDKAAVVALREIAAGYKPANDDLMEDAAGEGELN